MPLAAFQRRGRSVAVSFGNFSRGETKTVFLKVRAPTSAEGPLEIASVSLEYRDLVKGERGRVTGALGLGVVADRSAVPDMDAVVSGRLARSGTANALLQANDLVAQGKFEEANRILDEQQRLLAAAAEQAKRNAPAGRAATVDKDFAGQQSSLADASKGLQKSAPKPSVERARRANQETANRSFE
jgi:Ca-activated chloride channel homolog